MLVVTLGRNAARIRAQRPDLDSESITHEYTASARGTLLHEIFPARANACDGVERSVLGLVAPPPRGDVAGLSFKAYERRAVRHRCPINFAALESSKVRLIGRTASSSHQLPTDPPHGCRCQSIWGFRSSRSLVPASRSLFSEHRDQRRAADRSEATLDGIQGFRSWGDCPFGVRGRGG
jgi:hypothetical protein